MSNSGNIFSPKSSHWYRFTREKILEFRARRRPNLRGVYFYPPGHFYSPLLDIQSLEQRATHLPNDGVEMWENVQLPTNELRAYYGDAIERFPFLPFPKQKSDGFRFYVDNMWFGLPDAFALSSIMRKERPRKIVEAGSGFSSAVMLDTLDHTGASAALTFIEPYPDRLYSLLSEKDKARAAIRVHGLQQTPMSVFDQLEANDILFIDSSHVAKIGSDVSFILLRILPRLKPGVLVHFHDIFYPFTYPAGWIRDGRAWNESLFLRAFLIGNPQFKILAFNSYASYAFPELFREKFPSFLEGEDAGASFWLRKLS